MRYRFIDHIRGIAILMVILVHTSQSVSLSEGWLSIVTKYGQMGVQLFFVTSAYTLCVSYSNRQGEINAVINFYIRRFFRIAPIYYIGIIGYFILKVFVGYLKTGQIAIPDQYTIINVVSNVVFVHGVYYPANNNIVPGGWSIGTEMLFYLVFPLLVLLVSKVRHNLLIVVMAPVFSLILSGVILSLLGVSVGNNSFVYYSILNQFPVFAVGISLYLLHAHHSWFVSRLHSAILVFLFFVFSLLSIYIGWVSELSGAFNLVPFFSAISFFLLIEVFKRMDLENLGLLESIGQRSYSMYIIHFIFAHQLSRGVSVYFFDTYFSPEVSLSICYLITVAITFQLAGWSSKYIESFFIKKGKQLIKTISNKSIQQTAKAAAD